MEIGVGFICLLAPEQFYVGLFSGPVRATEWLFIFNGRCNFHKEELRCCDKRTSLRQNAKAWAQSACWLQPGGSHSGSRQRLSPPNDVHRLDKESEAQHAPSCHPKPSALGHCGAFKLQIPQRLSFFFPCSSSKARRPPSGWREGSSPRSPSHTTAHRPSPPHPHAGSRPSLQLPLCRKRPLGSIVIAGCRCGSQAPVALPARLPSQTQEGMLQTGWRDVSPTPAFAALAHCSERRTGPL